MGADTNGTGLTKAGYDGMFKKATMTGYLAARIEMLIESFCEEQDVEAGEMLFLVGGYLAGKRQGTPQL